MIRTGSLWMVPVLALSLVAALPSLAGPHGGRGGPHAAGMHGGHARGAQRMAHLAEALELTEAQRGELEKIVTRYHEGELGESQGAVETARRELGSVVHDPSADEQQVLDAAARVSARAQQRALTMHRMVVEISGILTEEQREKARELHQQREAGEWGEHGRWPCED